MIYNLSCAILGQKTDAFTVKIDDAQTVGKLKEEMKKVMPKTLGSFDNSALTLYKVDIDTPGDYTAYQQVIEQISRNAVTASKEPLINPLTELSAIFGQSIPAKGRIHILIKLPPGTGSKRLASADPEGHAQKKKKPDNNLSAIHRTLDCPSKGIEVARLASTQTASNRHAVLNGRGTNLTGPPLSIYHPIFQTFMQKYNSDVDRTMISAEDCELAHRLTCASTNYYETERERLAAIRSYLEPFFGRHATFETKISSRSRDWIPDGHAPVVCGFYRLGDRERKWMVKLVFELDNDLGLTVEQAERDYFLTCTASFADRVREVSCLPAFLVGMSGPVLNIHGAIFLAEKVVSAPLAFKNLVSPTQYIPLNRGYTSVHDQNAWHTAHMLGALRMCLEKLDNEYETMKEKSNKLHLDVRFHAPHFKQFQSVTGGYFSLKYLSHLVDNTTPTTRSVFLADAVPDTDLGSSTKCVVKFTQQYGKLGHEVMEKQGATAELLYCDFEISIGLWVVITRYYKCEENAVPSATGLAKLRAGLSKLHTAGLVDGDIRPPNIVVDADGQPRLFDFDWSDKVGVARYPIDLNTVGINWPDGVTRGGLIEMNHDIEMLGRYVEGNCKGVIEVD